MNKNQIFKAAIYVRLSKEDSDVSDTSKAKAIVFQIKKNLSKIFSKIKQILRLFQNVLMMVTAT
jgi:hypothetical protein